MKKRFFALIILMFNSMLSISNIGALKELTATWETRLGMVPYEYINFVFPTHYDLDDYLILVEKDEQNAALFKFKDSISSGTSESLKKNAFNEIELLASYKISTGRAHGNKQKRGDLKTPEGLYYAQDFMSEQLLKSKYGSLAAQYGTGAWELWYPNELDRLRQKTGSGIWIHGTDADMIPYDSEGCVRFENDVITYFREVLNIRKTPIIINEVFEWVNMEYLKNEVEKINDFFSAWLDSWQKQNIDEYLSFYSTEHFVSNNQKMNYARWATHKKEAFNKETFIDIKVSGLNYYYSDNMLLISFTQEYTSSSMSDVGYKQLVFERAKSMEQSIWSIIQEEWNPLPNTNSR